MCAGKRDSKQIDRRRFMLGTLKTACGVGLIGLGLGLYSQRASSLPAWALRPPRALPQGDFDGACILEEAAIRVLPRHLTQGKLGAHYRLGWEQQKQAGGALVTPDAEHRYNLPEGMRYDHAGEGLIEEPSPFPSNPLDTSNKK
ncbi:MAG: hypothetical protein WBG92_06145 [Thiohalocapsa sp.]